MTTRNLARFGAYILCGVIPAVASGHPPPDSFPAILGPMCTQKYENIQLDYSLVARNQVLTMNENGKLAAYDAGIRSFAKFLHEKYKTLQDSKDGSPLISHAQKLKSLRENSAGMSQESVAAAIFSEIAQMGEFQAKVFNEFSVPLVKRTQSRSLRGGLNEGMGTIHYDYENPSVDESFSVPVTLDLATGKVSPESGAELLEDALAWRQTARVCREMATNQRREAELESSRQVSDQVEAKILEESPHGRAPPQSAWSAAKGF